MRAARAYARGPVPVDVCLKRVPSETLVDALVARSVRVGGTDRDELRLLRRDSERPLIHQPLAVRFVGKHPESSADRGVVRFVVSSGEEARDIKELHLEGVDFAGYDLNPVWLFAHDWEGLPIGRCLARRTFKRGDSYELWQDVEFTPEDLYPFGHQVGQMHVRGFLRSCSGGWQGTRMRVIRGADGKPERIIYLESDWMETSSCAVGIDKYAVQEAVLRGVLKQDGLDQFARAARIAATSVAYEIRENEMKTNVTDDAVAARAPKVARGTKRTLIDEHVMDNAIDDWPDGPPVVAERAATGDDADGAAGDDAAAAGGASAATAAEGADGTQAGDAAEGGDAAEAGGATGSGGGEGEQREPGAAAGDAEPGAGDDDTASVVAAAGSEDAAAVRAAVRVLNEFVTRSGMTSPTAVRGAVSQALDASVDELYANVMLLAQCAEEMRYRASDVFYEGRAGKADVERAVRERMGVVTERVVRAITTQMPVQLLTTDDMISRCVSRAESAIARAGNSLSDVRDALTMFGAEEDVATGQRAGRKISSARRQNLKTALDAVRSAMERLQGVLDEEPEPGTADGEDAIATGGAADAAVDSGARALVTRASGVLATRGVELPKGNSEADAAVDGDDAAEDAETSDVAVDAIALVERMAKLGSRFDDLVATRAAAPAAAPDATVSNDAKDIATRAAALAQRSSRIPGIRLPQHGKLMTT